jgi:hypothetical protein
MEDNSLFILLPTLKRYQNMKPNQRFLVFGSIKETDFVLGRKINASIKNTLPKKQKTSRLRFIS